jgi:DNA-binding MarR family transcriptional regulator
MACGQPYDVTRSVGHQLVGVMIQMRREAEARMAPHGLTDAQWKPLWAIQTGRASTANELARSMDIDASAVTRLLDRLEAKGLIERVRSAEDRRVVRLRLTPTGQEVTQVIPQVLATVNRDFLQGFAEAEIDQLRGFLTRMAANGAALPLAKNEAVTP